MSVFLVALPLGIAGCGVVVMFLPPPVPPAWPSELSMAPWCIESRDHMSLAVIYCDHGEQTCVAVAVPIKFPFHCDDGKYSCKVMQSSTYLICVEIFGAGGTWHDV